MLTCERLIVHFVAQQTLRVPGRRHVQRFVVIIRTLDGDKSRCGIGPDHLQNIREDAQSLKASPVLSSGFWSFGMAKAPSASTGLSFSSSRRFIRLNCRLSVRKFIQLRTEPEMRFAAQAKVTKGRKAPRTQRITEILARCNLRRIAGVSGAGTRRSRAT